MTQKSYLVFYMWAINFGYGLGAICGVRIEVVYFGNRAETSSTIDRYRGNYLDCVTHR